ncbi:alpha/beta hydrolase [Streptomyces sp. AC495_CC817]|uniref:alpha/beta hydrolase n=1 Tax=Streptomyces sp. AC495_CC817 TaxID=2823900 RepID=UPI001C26CD42|nr:alpha/beta fold hydrolase [Streptomyces sp. AC495_CC817]
MPALTDLIARGIRGTAVVSPALAGDLAYRAFFSTAPAMRVHPRDEATHTAACTGRLRVRDTDVVTYEWGAGDRTVLLLHGWRGRASQFAPLVRELVAEGLRVVAFDAPAHGSSGGRRTDVRDWVDAAEQLQAMHGPFAALIGHSFGALAALTAARTDVPTETVVVIAGAASPAAFVDEFAREFRLGAPTRARLERRFRERLGVDEEQLIRRYDAALHPLPEPTALLVAHDRGDRRMPDADVLRLQASHAGRSQLVRTEGFGHTRILQADAVLDAVVAALQGTQSRAGAGQIDSA